MKKKYVKKDKVAKAVEESILKTYTELGWKEITKKEYDALCKPEKKEAK